MIIGITGTLAAGKGTIVEYLVSKGFKHYSVREFLINILKEKGVEINRDSMVELANELRKKFGNGYIMEELYKKASLDKNAVIESIRAVGEIETLKKKKDFILFAVDANQKIRYERSLKRGSVTDNIGFEKFAEQENREMTTEDPHKQNLSACIEKADYKFENNGTIEELYKKVESVLNDIKKN